MSDPRSLLAALVGWAESGEEGCRWCLMLHHEPGCPVGDAAAYLAATPPEIDVERLARALYPTETVVWSGFPDPWAVASPEDRKGARVNAAAIVAAYAALAQPEREAGVPRAKVGKVGP